MDLSHITLQTGDLRLSPRSEVSDGALAATRELLVEALASEWAPMPDGYRLTASAAGDLLTFSVWPRYPASIPLVSCTVAREGDDVAARAWDRLRTRALGAGPGIPPIPPRRLPLDLPAPWLAVDVFLLALAADPAAAEWLADAERVIAWSWLTG